MAATADSTVVGVTVLQAAGLKQPYLEPFWRGRGLGDRFVSLAKRQRPQGLALCTFQINGPAHRFHERHGSVARERTDGSGNDEREPDIRYVWQPGE